MYVEFENIPKAWSVFDQFMFGKYVLVAPVLNARVNTRQVILFGEGCVWIHYWTGIEFRVKGEWSVITIDARVGYIPFFILKDSPSLIHPLFNT